MICLFLNDWLINTSIVISNIYTRKYKLFVNYFKFYLQMMEFLFFIFVYKRCKGQLREKVEKIKMDEDRLVLVSKIKKSSILAKYIRQIFFYYLNQK